MVLRQYCIEGISDDEDQLIDAHTSANALRRYGKGKLEWDVVIRRLRHKGVSIHGLVLRYSTMELKGKQK